MRLRALAVCVALALAGAIGLAQQSGKQDKPADSPKPSQDQTSTPPTDQPPPPTGQPPVFRTGINFVRVDVIVSDKSGNTVQPEQLNQGSDYVATVTVTNLSERKLDNLALSHIVPSGWELHNTRLGSVQAKSPEGIDYQDIRDDRVLSYFTIGARETKTVEVSFNAAYQGSYYLPSVSVEAMYDATKHAQSRGQWVKVAKSAR